MSPTNNANFNAWFGRSKILDDNGKPLVMFHATYNGEISVFDRLWSTSVRSPSMDTIGIWFSTNPGDTGAGMYAQGDGASIYPVFLRAEKTKYYDRFVDFLSEMHEAEGRRLEDQNPRGRGSTEGLRQKLKAEGYDSIGFIGNNVTQLLADVEELKAAIARAKTEYREEVVRLRGLGFDMTSRDGAPYQAKIDRLVESRLQVEAEISFFGHSTEFDGQQVIVVFEPDQIKSAIGNNGLYSRESLDITDRTEQPRLEAAKKPKMPRP